MWSISDLKSRAWNLLRRTYWKSFAVALVLSLILWALQETSGAVSRFMDALLGVTTAAASSVAQYLSDLFLGPILSRMAALPAYSLLWAAALAASLLIWAVPSILVAGPAQIGLNRFFMRARHGYTAAESLLFPFRKQYGNVVKISFFKALYTALWSLLLVIPGIVKSYEYYMVPYILSENPGIGRKRAFELSRAMTDGEKWNIFVLELSFIGWYLLSLATCGVGLAFLKPYVEATHAELYAAMRDKVFYLGAAAPQDLPGYTDGSGDTPFYSNPR